jgi:hypothetical protein
MVILKSLLVWLAIIPCAILNGGLRENVLVPLMGMKRALPLSGILLCALIFLVTWFLLPLLGPQSGKTYILIGICWLGATVFFEYLMGLLNGTSSETMLQAYNITTGNLWLIVVLFTCIVPYLVGHLKGMIIY